MNTDHMSLVNKLKSSETRLGNELVEIELKIAELDAFAEAEIKRHRDCMADLTERTVAAKRQLNSQVPFARLPVEVVTIIFLLACSEDPDNYKPLTPLRIGGVCHDWRTIAWSSSELWSSVTVCLEVQKEASKNQANLLGDWLLRAGKRPLSITAITREEDESWWDAPRADNAAFSLVLSYSARWRSVDLHIPSQWQRLLDGVRGNTLILEHLTITSELGSSHDAFLEAPQLHSVFFEGLNPNYLETLAFPWSQMTKLHLAWGDIQECLTIINKCSSLAHLVLVERRHPFAPDPPTVPAANLINLDGLTSLHVTSEAKVCSIMNCLSTPHLEDVEVCFSEDSKDFFCSLRALISRSACKKTITRFSFTSFIFSEEEMISFLSAFPNLSELDLENDEHAPSFSRIFTDALCSHESSSMPGLYLPNLVSVQYIGPITADSHGFLDMLDAIYGVGEAPKLKSVVIHSYDKSVKGTCDLPQSQLLRAKGMVVDIEYVDPDDLRFQRAWFDGIEY